MQKYRIAAVMLGGLFLASPAMAQSTHQAYATGEPRSEYMVFLEKGNVLPESAIPMVSKATKRGQGRQDDSPGGSCRPGRDREAGDDPRGRAGERDRRGARACEGVAQGG